MIFAPQTFGANPPLKTPFDSIIAQYRSATIQRSQLRIHPVQTLRDKIGTKRGSSDTVHELEDSKRQNTKASPGKSIVNPDEAAGVGLASLQTELGSDMDLRTSKLRSEFVPRQDLESMKSELKSELHDNINQVSTRLENLYLSHSAMVGSVNFHGDFLESINTRLQESVKREKSKDKQIEELKFELQETKASLRRVDIKTKENSLEIKSRNLVINRIPEKDGEVCKLSVTTFLKNIIPNFTAEKIANAYRLGKPAKNIVGGMLVKVKDVEHKQEVMSKKSALKNKKELKKIFCNDDQPDECRKSRQKMWLIAKYATSLGYKDFKAKGNNLIFEGRSYNEKELTLLPGTLRIENVVTRSVGLGVGFYGEHSYLSNQYPSRIMMNGQRFLCAEQALYYFKGVICQHEDTSLEIKKMIDPSEMKSLGEKIPTCAEWEIKKEKLMKSILQHKFHQNKHLRSKLVSTGRLILQECSTDMFWGTGQGLDSPNWIKSYNYKGQNRLGHILEEVQENYLPVSTSPIANQSGDVKAADCDTIVRNTSGDKSGSVNSTLVPSASGDTVPVAPTATADNLEVKENLSSGHSDVDSGATGPTSDNEQEVSNRKYTDSEIMEIENISFNTASLNASSESLNSTRRNESVSKVNKWAIPALNTSRLMNSSGFGTKEKRSGLRKLLQAQPGGDSFTSLRHSTPVITMVKKKPSPLKAQHETTEKIKLDQLQENI